MHKTPVREGTLWLQTEASSGVPEALGQASLGRIVPSFWVTAAARASIPVPGNSWPPTLSTGVACPCPQLPAHLFSSGCVRFMLISGPYEQS